MNTLLKLCLAIEHHRKYHFTTHPNQITSFDLQEGTCKICEVKIYEVLKIPA